jgi:hypothetical protein
MMSRLIERGEALARERQAIQLRAVAGQLREILGSAAV